MAKILITGLNGFIGSNLSEFVTKNYPDRLVDIVGLSSVMQKDIQTIIYDSAKNLKEIILPDIETVIHLGAWIPKLAADSDNIERSTSNISFTAELLSILPSTLKKIIFISTIDVYSAINETITERTIALPASLYGWSKLFCEQMVSTWAQQNKVNCQILRIGHIYGNGEDEYKKLIPVFITNILEKKPITISSFGLEKRSFLHVTDCVRCIWEAIDINSKQSTINIVSANPYSVKEIAEILLKISGEKGAINILNQNIPTKDLVFDNSTMKAFFGAEKVSLEEGLLEEFNYFKDKI